MQCTIFRWVTLHFLESDSSPSYSSNNNRREPRWRRVLRWALFKWWGIFAIFMLSSYIFGAVLVLVQKDWSNFISYLTSWGLLAPLERSQPILFGSLLTIFAILFLASFLANRYYKTKEKEKARQKEQQLAEAHQLAAHAYNTVQNAIDKHLIRLPPDENTLAPLGPPQDIMVLPTSAHFVGRSDDLKWLLERLNTRGTATISALCGLAGIGKTALAARAISESYLEGRFRDGIAVVLCQELTDAIDVLKRVLARFDPYRRQPDTNDPTVLTELALQRLSGKDALTVLDDVEPELAVEKLVTPLQATGITLLLTARQSLSYDAVPTEAIRILELLSPQDALKLFIKSFGRESDAELSLQDRVAAVRIVGILDRHTLAVKLAGAYAANVHRDLEEFARELEEDPLAAIEASPGRPPQVVALVFARSIEKLPAETRRLFTALAAFQTSEFSRRAVLALAKTLALGNPKASIDLLILWALLEATTRAEMPSESDRERLRMHLLLRTFARSKFDQWTVDERITVQQALATYYASYVNRKSTETLGFDEANIISALEWSHNHEREELIVVFILGMKAYWDKGSRTTELLRYLPWGMAAAEKIAKVTNAPADRLKAADLALAYAQALRPHGKVDDVEQAFKANLAIRREMQDRLGEGVVLATLGQSARRQGRLDEAESYLQEALVIDREVKNYQGEGLVLNALGRIARRRGKLDEAESYFQEALAINRKVQNQREEGVTLISISQANRDRGKLKEAESHYREALTLIRTVQDRRVESAIFVALGQISLYYGAIEQAERYYHDALTIAQNVRDRVGEGIALSRLGQLARERGQLEEAASYYKLSLARAYEMNSRREEGVVLGLLGQLARDRGELEEAASYYQKALTIIREVQDRRGEGVLLAALGQLAQDGEYVELAEKYYREGLDILRGQDVINYAATALAFGSFLLQEKKDYNEGCPILTEAIRLYSMMELLNERIRNATRDLGCAE